MTFAEDTDNSRSHAASLQRAWYLAVTRGQLPVSMEQLNANPNFARYLIGRLEESAPTGSQVRALISLRAQKVQSRSRKWKRKELAIWNFVYSTMQCAKLHARLVCDIWPLSMHSTMSFSYLVSRYQRSSGQTGTL